MALTNLHASTAVAAFIENSMRSCRVLNFASTVKLSTSAMSCCAAAAALRPPSCDSTALMMYFSPFKTLLTPGTGNILVLESSLMMAVAAVVA